MTTRAADDYATIRSRMNEIGSDETAFQRGECAVRAGKGADRCWCYRAGPNGNSLPCPPVPEGTWGQGVRVTEWR